MQDNHKKQNEKLLELVREIVRMDGELRAKFQVGEKFRFIRDRLRTLLTHTEEHLTAIQKKTAQKQSSLSENETLVFVHLFNSQGIMLQSWQKMLVPSVFYDHSVNRPIYSSKEQIEEFIRSKANKIQHAYLTIGIEKTAILSVNESDVAKDGIGGAVVKVKEGSLKFHRLISFTHNDNEYVVNEDGELVRKRNNTH